MAISLKNIDDRLKVLEQSGSSYSETVIWSGSQAIGNWSSVTLTMNQSVDNFHFILVKAVTWRTLKAIIAPVSHLSSSEPIDVNFGGDSSPGGHRNVMLSKVSSTQLKFAANDIDTARIYKVTGVKFSKVILYYFSNIIKSKILHSNISAINNLLVKFVSSSPKIFSKGGIEFGY